MARDPRRLEQKLTQVDYNFDTVLHQGSNGVALRLSRCYQVRRFTSRGFRLEGLVMSRLRGK